jgi:hypothetical protein
MRRRTLLIALAGLAVVVAAGAVVQSLQPVRITQQDFNRIKPWMTRAEVAAILGPPGDYRTADSHTVGDCFWRPLFTIEELLEDRVIFWYTDGTQWVVRFDERGRVTSHFSRPLVRVEATPLDNLLWRAKRQWHRWFPE